MGDGHRRIASTMISSAASDGSLRKHLTGTEFARWAGRGEQMDGSQVIHFALEAITRAAAKA
jgi:hypothetical protein